MTRFRLLSATLAAAMLAAPAGANDLKPGASDRAPKLAAAPKLTTADAPPKLVPQKAADPAPAPRLVGKTAEPAAGIVAPAAAVVTVKVPTGNGEGWAGTGSVVWAEAGKSYVVTNLHVIEDNRGSFAVTVNSTGKTYPARVLNRSAEGDAALLEVVAELPAVALGTDAVPGTIVTNYGNKSGPQRGKVTRYEWQGRPAWSGTVMLADYMSTSGDSGGPVANDRGELVGVHWGGVNDQFGRPIAGERSIVPVGVVRRLLRDVLASRLPRLAARLSDDAASSIPAPPVSMAAHAASPKSADNCPCPAGACALGCAAGCAGSCNTTAAAVGSYRVGNGPWLTADQFRQQHPQLSAALSSRTTAAAGTCAGGACYPAAASPRAVYYYPAGSACANGKCPTPAR